VSVDPATTVTDDACRCLITAGRNMKVTGGGVAINPYTLSAIVTPSAEPGNRATAGSDGRLYVPAWTVADTTSVDLSGNATAASPLTGVLRRDTSTAGQAYFVTGTGNYVPSIATSLAQTAAMCDAVADCTGTHLSAGLAYTTATHLLALKVSTDAGNLAAFGPDTGLYAKIPDTGWIDNATTPWLTFQTGFAQSPTQPSLARYIGQQVFIVVGVQRTGANLVPNAGWDIAVAPMFTITDTRFQPSVAGHTGRVFSSTQIGGYTLSLAGAANLETINSTLSTGQNLATSNTYLRP